MKVAECPVCGSYDLTDRWIPKRKLKQCCPDCGWKGEARTPEVVLISTKKSVEVDHFGGFHYEIFDCFGHIMMSSRYYQDKNKALQELRQYIEHGKNDKDAGPYTAVLWPDFVEVEGEVFVST